MMPPASSENATTGDAKPKVFEGKGTFTPLDQWHYARYVHLIVMGWMRRIAVILGCVGVVWLLLFSLTGEWLGIGTLIFVAVTFVVAFQQLIAPWVSWKRNFKQGDAEQAEVFFAFSDEAIEYRHQNLEFRLAWSGVDFILETPHGFLFGSIAAWIPRRLFPDDSYRKRLLEIACGHRIRIIRMR